MAAGIHNFTTVAWLAALTLSLPHTGFGQQPAPPTVELREVQSRESPSFTPTLQRQRVTVKGVVSTKAINFGEYAHLPIQNREGTGLVIESGRSTMDAFGPGDIVRAIGVVSHRAGLPVLALETISKEGQQDAPVAQNVRFSDLTRFETTGKYITVESLAITIGQNSGGDVLVIGGGNDASVLVFYPRFKRWNRPGIGSFHAGDKVRVTGIASQYCPVEPYDRGFQIVIDDPSQIVLLEKGWTVPPEFMAYFAIFLLFALATWWMREHRMAELRRTIRSMMSLSEDVLAASSIGEIARKVQAVLPRILNAWGVEVYLFNRMRNTLDRIPGELSPDEVSIAVDRPNGAFASAVTLCFRNRALLNVPDFRKNPVVDAMHEADLPASAVFVPMFAKGEVLGVLAVNFEVRLRANRNQQAALQHVANQIAASLKLQEQQSIREQLLRTEKMAAAGQLISAVAHDLRAPLNAIRETANRLSSENGAAEGAEITAEADRGLQIVGHLLSFARMEGSESREVNLHQLISGVMEAREPEWRRKGIPVENALPVSPLDVFADESELEQVMLSLLIHVEHAAQTNQTTQPVRVSSRVLGSRVQISVDFTGTSLIAKTADEPTPGDSFSLRVCQAIVQSHGGDIRLLQMPQRRLRYELELPVYNPPLPTDITESPSRNASRMLTAILIEPDATLQRRLLAMLSARGHRAIPVESPEEAADMVQRMSFDVIFCTSRLPRLSWIEFFKRVRRRIASFVLLAEEQEVDAGNILKDGTGFILRKPVEETALDSVLADVESRHGASR